VDKTQNLAGGNFALQGTQQGSIHRGADGAREMSQLLRIPKPGHLKLPATRLREKASYRWAVKTDLFPNLRAST
jgi:hypothetical protein